ncbi:ribbon-helix-helix domain-containing protein [Parvularcula marina]|uniref:Aryl-sulfate sulfotransferase n=1 Tax=Parvularcula marina TaxID=2292771 RepID=A0A371RKG7_9PROT|nr:ribbon-helix-helix domain-containing protein [Parvularcula marina]RFB05876.1 aryl-sulfate sulfotransferase [Parvularcula marina]
MGAGHLIKRSVTLQGHRTSVSLEAEFWTLLDEEAARQSVPCSRLVAEIDRKRGSQPLASALRVAAISIARKPPPPVLPAG